MDPVSHFSQSYVEARAKFLAAARMRDLAVETHVLSGHRGIDGELLAMDVTLVGDADAKGLLLLTSATHGIEGYCGSGAQIGLLHDPDFTGAVRDTRACAMFVHAINPHGFSWGRRVNEDNVDLNRNFRDFTRPPPVNTAYAGIHAALLPASWPPSQANQAEIGRWIAEHGERALQAVVSGGQYAFPDGLFYGGAGPSWSNRTLRSLLRRHAATRTRLGWIDLHTGLGPRGHGERIYAGRDAREDLARSRDWWGADVTAYQDGTASAAPLTGVMYNATYDECGNAEYAGIALEYGTLPLPDTFLALRADHWLHNHPEAPAAQRSAIRRQVRDAFYADADDWKERVYAQARDAALTALGRLAENCA